jgi:hypothetical protein
VISNFISVGCHWHMISKVWFYTFIIFYYEFNINFLWLRVCYHTNKETDYKCIIDIYSLKVENILLALYVHHIFSFVNKLPYLIILLLLFQAGSGSANICGSWGRYGGIGTDDLVCWVLGNWSNKTQSLSSVARTSWRSHIMCSCKFWFDGIPHCEWGIAVV